MTRKSSTSKVEFSWYNSYSVITNCVNSLLNSTIFIQNNFQDTLKLKDDYARVRQKLFEYPMEELHVPCIGSTHSMGQQENSLYTSQFLFNIFPINHWTPCMKQLYVICGCWP